MAKKAVKLSLSSLFNGKVNITPLDFGNKQDPKETEELLLYLKGNEDGNVLIIYSETLFTSGPPMRIIFLLKKLLLLLL